MNSAELRPSSSFCSSQGLIFGFIFRQPCSSYKSLALAAVNVAAGVQCGRFPQDALLSLICRYIEALIEVQKGVSFEVFFADFFHGEKFRLFLNAGPCLLKAL